MFGRNFAGRGQRGGMDLGFGGSAPPWPYVGRGRGGLPRCQYPGLATTPVYAPASPYPSRMTREQEIDWLKSQAEDIKTELNRVEARLRDLEAGK